MKSFWSKLVTEAFTFSWERLAQVLVFTTVAVIARGAWLIFWVDADAGQAFTEEDFWQALLSVLLDHFIPALTVFLVYVVAFVLVLAVVAALSLVPAILLSFWISVAIVLQFAVILLGAVLGSYLPGNFGFVAGATIFGGLVLSWYWILSTARKVFGATPTFRDPTKFDPRL